MKYFSSYSSLFLCITAITLVGFHSLAANWTPPSATPPSNNVPAPINVGTSTQQKAGTLGVGGLGVFGSSYIQGASTTEIYNEAVTLEVEGKIGADLYCDEMGNNCVTTLGQGSNGGVIIDGQQDYGASLLAGWPDIIFCDLGVSETRQVGVTDTNENPIYRTTNYIVYNAVLERQGTPSFIRRGQGEVNYGYLSFNIDGSLVTRPNAGGGNCHQSMQELSAQGRTFAYGVSPYNFVTNIRYIAGGHSLTKTLQDAGVPGIRNWNVSSIGARNAEMAWVCNYFHPGSVPVDVRIGAYSSPSDNGMHLLDANGQWQWYGARAYNSRIDGLYCRLP